MAKKDFVGQYSGEKLLLRTSESGWCFFMEHIMSGVGILVMAGLIVGIGYAITDGYIIPAIIAAVLVAAYVWYLSLLHHHTYFIITSRRVIKNVKPALFSMHRREMTLEKIEQMRTEETSYLDTLLGYGNIHLTSHDLDSSIYFRGLAHHHEIVAYISRVIDHIRTNGQTDDISSFRTRADRERTKKAS